MAYRTITTARLVVGPDGQPMRENVTETVWDDTAERTIRDRAQQALDANATYLAIASPNSTQVTAQVNRLSRECTATIRLLLGLTEDTTGT